MKKTYFKQGDWNIECDICRNKIKHSKSKKTFDGLLTCKRCWRERHPNSYPASKIKERNLPAGEVRPQPEVSFQPGLIIPGTWESYTIRRWEDFTTVNWEDWGNGSWDSTVL